MILLICGILKKWHRWTYLQNRNKVTDIENKHGLLGGKAEAEGREKLGDWDWHTHTAIYKTDN